MKTCDKCMKHDICRKHEAFGAVGCVDDFQQKPQTNADKIRSMSDEELAEFLSETHDEAIGKFLGDITICDNNIKSIFEWLQSEAPVSKTSMVSTLRSPKKLISR